MGSLQHVQHRTVVLVEESPRDVHPRIGRNADQISVVCTVMYRAEAEAVTNNRYASLLRIADNMRRIE